MYSVQQAHSVFAGLSAVWADLWLYVILAESLVKRRCGMSADLLPDSLDMHMDSNHWNLPHSWLLSFPWAVYNREIMVRMLTVRRPSTRHADTVMQGTEEAHRIQWNLLIFKRMIQINLLIHSSSFLFCSHVFAGVSGWCCTRQWMLPVCFEESRWFKRLKHFQKGSLVTCLRRQETSWSVQYRWTRRANDPCNFSKVKQKELHPKRQRNHRISLRSCLPETALFLVGLHVGLVCKWLSSKVQLIVPAVWKLEN